MAFTKRVAACCWRQLHSAGVGNHSFAAEYDANKPLVLKGVVTKMEWMKPSFPLLSVGDGSNGKSTV